MLTPRPGAVQLRTHGAARPRAGWTLALLVLLVTPFAGVVAPAPVQAHHTSIKLPFASGATWRVLQGYNGSSHQNTSSTYQYYYALDLVRADGNTAGQRVISPVDGTIRWIDTDYGGMSINLGDGYAFAYFHTDLAPGLAAGQTVTQGQYLGTIAAPGDAGNGGTPHIHVTLWTTNDGGNWDRHAAPFTGDHKIDGYDFPDRGGSNQYVNTQVVSSNVEIAAVGGASGPDVPTLLSPATGTTYTTSPVTTTLRWNAVSGATAYQVVINDGNITSPWVSGTSWTTPSFGNGQYTWQVRARNDAGTSNLSAKWVFWVDPGTTPTPTPTPPAGGSTTLAMSLDTTSGRVGTTVTASGTGYGASETIRLYIDSVTSAHQIAQTKANSSGAWSASFAIPDATGGNHAIIGRGLTTDKRVTKTFKVTPYLNRTPYQGPVGTTINLTVQGFGASETVTVTFDSTSGRLLRHVTTDANGTGTTTFPLPSASNGWHDYVGVGGTSGLSAWGALYIEQSLTVNPTSGAPGTTIVARARGFPASSSITVAWNKVAGSSGTRVCSGTTTSEGSYNCSFAIPQAGAGSYPLVATAGGISDSASVGVSGPPSVTISPTSAPVSGNIAITAGGFGANETVNFTWDSSTSVWQARQTDGSGSLSFPALVPNLSTGSHTLKAKGATSGKSATRSFTVVSGSSGNSSQIGPGTFAVTATEEGLIGETTSNGHKIVTGDNFVALPACTQSSCPWVTPGGSTYVAACGDNCYVRVTNPANNTCRVAPVYDVGPWFTNDNWWDPTNQRNLNNLSTTKNILPQGYTGADAAKDGLDVGYGISNGVGVSNVGYQVGNRAALDLGDGTWTGIGFARGDGIGQVVVTILWLTGEDHTAAANACGQGGTSGSAAIALSRSSGGYGTSVTVTGTGFAAGETVDFYLDSTSSAALGSAKASSSGGISGSIKVLDATGGDHKVYAKGRTSGRSAFQSFTVTPLLIRNPGSGEIGDKILVSAKGYGANESIELRWNVSTGSVVATLKTDGNGSARGSFLIPQASADGTHRLYGVGLTSGLQTYKTLVVDNPAANGGTPGVSLSRTSGGYGMSVTVSGSSFAAGETVDLYFDSTSGAALGSVKASSSGDFSVAFKVPDATGGDHKVYARGRSSGDTASAPFEVTPRLIRNPGSGAIGDKILVSAKGYAANESIELRWNVSTGTVQATLRTDGDGSARGSFLIPKAAADGTHRFYAVGLTSGLQTYGTLVVSSPAVTGDSPGIALSRTSGGYGTSVTVSGSGFGSGETVDFYLDSTNGAVLGSAKASSDGDFTGAIKVLDVTGGSHKIYAKGRTSGDTASASFSVTPRLIRNPSSGAIGDKILVSAKGYGANESIELRWDASSGSVLVTLRTDGDGSARGSFLIPQGSADGTHRVYGVGLTSGLQTYKTLVVDNPDQASVSLSPATGSPRSNVTANGTNFAANETVDLFWDSSTSSGGSATANSAGGVAVDASVPLMPTGAHTVTLTGRTSGRSASATYTVVQSLELAPASGDGGSPVTVKGRGWVANATVNVYWDRTATTTGIRVCTVTTSATGTFTCTFTAPGVSTGTYPVVGVAGAQTAAADFRLTGPAASSLAVDEGTPTAEAGTPTAMPTETPTAEATSTESGDATATAEASPTETTAPSEPQTATPSETATPTATATATETPTATAEATPAEKATLTLSPNRGTVGTEVTVSGSGFGPGEQVDLYFHSTDTDPLATVQADADGTITGSVTVPDAAAGNDRIVARGQTSGVTAKKTFRVTSPRAERSDAPAEDPTATPSPDVAEDQQTEATATDVPTEEPAPTEAPTEVPTPEPVPQDLVFLPVADTSVAAPNPEGTPTAGDPSQLAAGGPNGAVAYVTFQVDGVAEGSVVSAQLVLTNVGDAGAAAGTIGALGGVWADEGWTYETAPVADVPPAIAVDGSAAGAGWLDPWVETAIDVTGTVGGDGTVTFVIFGTGDAELDLGSRASGAPPRLVVTVLTPAPQE